MPGQWHLTRLVLVFSDHANDSEHVGHVVANAFGLGLAVIPLRIEAVNPKDHLAYFLETVLVLVSVGVIHSLRFKYKATSWSRKYTLEC